MFDGDDLIGTFLWCYFFSHIKKNSLFVQIENEHDRVTKHSSLQMEITMKCLFKNRSILCLLDNRASSKYFITMLQMITFLFTQFDDVLLENWKIDD